MAENLNPAQLRSPVDGGWGAAHLCKEQTANIMSRPTWFSFTASHLWTWLSHKVLFTDSVR